MNKICNYSGSQEPEFRSRNEGAGGYLILAKDLESGDVSELSQLLEEVNKLSEAYSRVILNSDS